MRNMCLRQKIGCGVSDVDRVVCRAKYRAKIASVRAVAVATALALLVGVPEQDAFGNPLLEQVAEGGVNFMKEMTHPSGFPHNEATAAELAAPEPQIYSSTTFVPAQLGASITVDVLSNAYRRQTGGTFSAGLTDADLLSQLTTRVSALSSDILDQPGRTYVDAVSGKKALYQVYDTVTGVPPLSTGFESTVSLLDNAQLLVGLQFAESYLREIATGSLDPGVNPADLIDLADDIDDAIQQFDISMWHDDVTLRLGNAFGPLGAGDPQPTLPKLNRITTEGRIAPVAGLALGHLNAQQFDSTLDLMISGSEMLVDETHNIERLPFVGTALESFAVTPYLSSELTTIFGTDTLIPLVDANIQSALDGGVLPAAGATGVADGFGQFRVFGLTPSETPAQHADVNVLIPPAAGMMAGATGTAAAMDNLSDTIDSLTAGGLMDATFGVPNYQDFGTGLVNMADPVRGTLEIGQMTVAVLNRLLGGGFIEDILRQDAAWDAALDAYLDTMDRRVVIQQAEVDVSGDGSPIPRENASLEEVWHLDDVGDQVAYDIVIKHAGKYKVSWRFSNSDTGALDELTISLNGDDIAVVESTNTLDWNVFTESDEVFFGLLLPGTIELGARLTDSDGFGIDLDRFRLERFASALQGDISDDGEVDIADFTLWADSFGETGLFLAADLSMDGEVDIADFTVWADNFGQTAALTTTDGSATESVPEPRSVMLLLIGLVVVGGRLACAARRYRRRSGCLQST